MESMQIFQSNSIFHRLTNGLKGLFGGNSNPISNLSETIVPATDFPSLDSPAVVDHSALDFDKIFSLFQKSVTALKDVSDATESDFLTLGNELQTIYAEAERLTQMVAAALSTNKGLTLQNILEKIQLHAQNALEELMLRRAKLEENLTGLVAMQDKLKALSRENGNFKRVAKNLKMVGLNISIESVRTQEARAAYQVLAEEINRLAQNVAGTAEHVSDDTKRILQNLQMIHNSLGTRMHHLNDLIHAAEKMVKDSLNKVEELMQLSIKAMDHVRGQSEEVKEQVAQLVVGIQIHDNISQRITHIASSINEAVDYIENALSMECGQEDRPAAFGRAYNINRLQVSQLKAMAEDVADTGVQNASALERLLVTVEAIALADGINTTAEGSICHFDARHSSHPVAVLKAALTHLIDLFDQGVEDLNRLTEASHETGVAIQTMTTHIDKVRDINFDIHLKALNAVVKSTRLGETGKAIEAIVYEMKSLAEQSNTTIQTVAEIMEDVASTSQLLDQSAHEKESVQNDAAGQLLHQGIEDFSTVCNVFKDHSQNAVKLGGELQKKISFVRRRLDFFDKMVAVFNSSKAELEKADALFQPLVNTVSKDWLQQEQQLMERYTMQREREAHQMTVNDGQQLKTDITETIDDSDDNIEFF